MEEIRRLRMPLSREDALSLRAGEMVLLDGEIVITAGLPTHHRLAECAAGTREAPRDLHGAGLFHLGSYSRETQDGAFEVLYMNPTTSTRFNALMPGLIRHFGLRAVGGKGGLDAGCVAAMQEAGCVYLSFVGGGAPLLSDAIREVVSVHWNDLVSHYRLVTLRVEALGPLTVGIDAHGNSLYGDLNAAATARLPAIMAELARERDNSGEAA
ncbi:fumarate hydratase C-terminal domain-containing protein [Roseomonas marmotae]|uniref:Fumarate hydratase C-terminal domain-containing protein n=1 Tax=Roseomonas marmotae TaxID=2768161 RepID=A0ABS3KIL8_9PROT|nr:fumarate hydratase C-terminal domain-containing protein [Roseomonas marmotae]MBO1076847.1 fumarate hydratase C-terminal domain-containing protein [Roseomonas marmotae]QTI81185.1 fumarate hydratase C-terminal domain-containing protein [Roseomonas marmotae]